ncbi:MAG: SLC13 family permease [Candidatus Omnitrophica bacterium]|nr:SLC13 family permease [Candidatus Omnitrophota bacterium]
MEEKNIFKKSVILITISLLIGLLAYRWGLSFHQSTALSIFFVSILGTLFFWHFRLTFAFLGTSVLLLTKTIDMDHIIKFASLEVILFLIGMMVLVGMLKSAGFFAWIVTLILRIKNLTARRFLFIISVVSALLACAIDEVTAIIFVAAAIFEICDYFEADPTPFLMIAVFATNIGSAGTVLGNPIGILIATKSGLTFEDFLMRAFPVMVICLLALIFIMRGWYSKVLDELDEKIRLFGENDILTRLISVPPARDLKISLGVFAATICAIALHHRIELWWNLEPNTVLLVLPLISSGIVMIWKHGRARNFIEKDVEWWTLLFFMLLFAQAGTLKFTGAADTIAQKIISTTTHNVAALTGVILWISSIGSSILDNVVLVAAVIPVVQSFKDLGISIQPLWWALLFGGCFGGNITLIGSTANIVALGLLEKEEGVHMSFFRWFRIGLVVGVVTTLIAWTILLVFPMYR